MKRASCLVALTLVLAAPAALAQFFTVVPGQSFKTPPLADSDSFVLVIDTHIPVASPPQFGWSGSIVKVHILDNTESDVVLTVSGPFFTNPLGPPNGPVVSPGVFSSSPFGPPSNNLQSVPVSFNIYTNAPSGFSVLTSSPVGLLSALIHAKNTTPANNSDVDATVMLWNIYHVRVSSTFLTAPESVRIWVTSLGQNPGGTLGDPDAHWTHVATTTLLHAQQSAYFATFVGTILVGIEHVPEPATGGLLAGGLLALAGSRAARRRRLKA